MQPTDYEYLLACKIVTLLQGTPWSRQAQASSAVASQSTFVQVPKIDHFLQEFQTMGWQLVTTSERERIDAAGEFGYMGACFIHPERKQLIVAQRGTQFSELGNVLADLVIMKKEVPDILLQGAIPFIGWVHQFNQDKKFTISHSGFSLGGFLAEAGAACSAHRWRGAPYSHERAVCFDSPGAENALQRLGAAHPDYQGMLSNKTNTVVYVVAPNLVNTANPHHGEVRQIKSYVHYVCGLEERLSRGVKLVFDDDGMKTEEILLETAKTHNQDRIRAPLSLHKASLEYVSVSAWPLAANQLEMADFPAAPGMLPPRSTLAKVSPAATYDAYQEVKTEMIGRLLFRFTFDALLQQGAVAIEHKVDRSILYATPTALPPKGLVAQSFEQSGLYQVNTGSTLRAVGSTLERQPAKPGNQGCTML